MDESSSTILVAPESLKAIGESSTTIGFDCWLRTEDYRLPQARVDGVYDFCARSRVLRKKGAVRLVKA